MYKFLIQKFNYGNRNLSNRYPLHVKNEMSERLFTEALSHQSDIDIPQLGAG